MFLPRIIGELAIAVLEALSDFSGADLMLVLEFLCYRLAYIDVQR
jgi:hypothetical protein